MDMFSQEINGYNREEVDNYIKRLRMTYEAKLMEEKLKVLDCEKKLLDLKTQRNEIENKEKNIMNALNVFEKAKQFQEEGSLSFCNLIIQKSEILLQELTLRFPSMKNDKNFVDIISEFDNMLDSFHSNIEKMSDITRPIFTDSDSMRALLSKMQDQRKVDQPKEIHIATVRVENQNTNNAPQNSQESGFSLEEALHPKQDLEEIMKAFDFYNENQNWQN